MYWNKLCIPRLRMAQSIQRQLEEMEVKQKELEDQGVRLERTLRGEEGGTLNSIFHLALEVVANVHVRRSIRP